MGKEEREKYEEYDEGGILDDISDFIKLATSGTPKGVTIDIIIVGVILFFVLTGLMQSLIFDPTYEPSINPLLFIPKMFLSGHGLMVVFPFVLISVFVILLSITASKKMDEKAKKKSRYNDIDSANAHYATDKEMIEARKLEYETLDQPEDIVLGKTKKPYSDQKEEKAVCVPVKSFDNLNIAIFGPSGSGKTRNYVMSNLLMLIDKLESFVVIDPSGDLYIKTAKLAREEGMKVKSLNLNNIIASAGFDLLSDLKLNKNSPDIASRASILSETIISNASGDGQAFYEGLENNLLQALMLYVAISPKFHGEEHERHFGTVYDLIVKIAEAGGDCPTIAKKGEDGKTKYVRIFEDLDVDDPAKEAWYMYQGGTDTIKRSAYTGLSIKLAVFKDMQIKEVFSHDDINISELWQEPCAYYIIAPVGSRGKPYRFILSLFFGTLFNVLMSDGEREGTNGSVALPRPVFIIMDEFASVGTINEFPKTLANVRRYNIKVSIIFQDTPQIQNCYPDEAQSILSNCATWLVLGVNDTDTARLLCDRIGDTTGESASYAIQKNKVMTIDPFDQRISKSETKEPLLRIGDLFTLAEVIILRSKMNVYLADPYVYLYHYLSEYVDRDDMHEHASTFDPHWAYRTMSLKRTFTLSDPNRDIQAAETGGKSDTRKRSNFIEEDDNDGNVFTSRSRRPKQDKKNDQKSEKRRPRKWETKAEEKPNYSEMEPDKDVLTVPWGTEE